MSHACIRSIQDLLTVHIFHDSKMDFLWGDPLGFPLVVYFDLVLRIAVLLGVEHGAVTPGFGGHLDDDLERATKPRFYGDLLNKCLKY